MYYYFRKNGGFTLIEIMLVVSILGIAFTIFYSFMDYNIDYLNSSNADNNGYLQARTAMSEFTEEIQKYQRLQITDDPTATQPHIYVLEGLTYKGSSGTDRLINCTDITDNSCIFYSSKAGIGQLYKSGNMIADNVSITVAFADNGETPDDDSHLDSQCIVITVEAFPDKTSSMNSIKLSTQLRLDRSRPNL